jgi:predicted ATPase
MVKAIEATAFLLSATLLRDRVPSFEAYPFSLPAVRNLRSLDFKRPVTFLIGENGSGKSTLLEAIAIAWGFNPEGGSKNFRFTTRVSHSNLHEYLRLSKGIRRPRDGYFLRAESFFNVASEIERLDEEPEGGAPITASYGGVSLHAQSHGESFMSLLIHRFSGKGLYILDEPEAALSPTRQMAMLTRMNDLVRSGSQFVIATHSPIILAYPEAEIFALEPEGLRKVAYEDTEHFNITRQFLNNHRAMLRELFDEDEA